ncbi:MAG: aminofutalosine synthase MqnE [Candidatus Omnitrophota bacterium]
MSSGPESSEWRDLARKIECGERLGLEDGLRLYRTTDLHGLGKLARQVRERLNGRRVFYSVNLHLNHTNICSSACLFCSFAKGKRAPEAYALSPAEIFTRVREAVETWHIHEVHMTGGHNPDLGLDYYLEVLGGLRSLYPGIFLKALTAPEIDDLASRSGLDAEKVLKTLKAAGLDGLPGGGAEIFDEEVRGKICPQKITAGRWLEIHGIAHRLGLVTNATMLYGHIETDAHRVDHVLRLRDQQDATGGFQSFIPLAYQPVANPMRDLGAPGGVTDLKVYAVSRLLLDNIPHLKCYWVTTGLKMAQVALSFGVDDLGGTNLEERIMHEAGSGEPRDLGDEDLVRLIREAGYEPCRVDSAYRPVAMHS